MIFPGSARHRGTGCNLLRAFEASVQSQIYKESTMVSFIVRMRFAPEDREKVSEILRELALASRQEPGCVSYVPHTVEEDPNMVVIYEQYRDRAASEFHRTTPHFKSSPSAACISSCASERLRI